MTIDKAIEILQILAHNQMPPDIDDFNKALDLAIEALKRVLAQRKRPQLVIYDLLPGETKE